MTNFRGVGVALITPFKADKSIDYDALSRLLNSCNEGEVDYLVVNGTTSEASTLTTQEKKDILAFIIANNVKALPIVYGIGANNTQHVLDLIDETDFSSIDAILTVSPYYNRPSQQGIIKHYEIVASHSPVPVILYNVPGRTGSNMTAETTLTLAQHKNIIAIKEASGDLTQCLKILKDKPNDFMLISGDDILTVPMISLGAEGVISVLANAFPARFGSAIHHALENNFSQATSIISDFVALNELLYVESNPVGVKEVLTQQGLCGNHVRLPLLEASSELKQAIAQLLPVQV